MIVNNRFNIMSLSITKYLSHIYIYIYIYMCVCVCVCVFMSMCVCVYIYIYIVGDWSLLSMCFYYRYIGV